MLIFNKLKSSTYDEKYKKKLKRNFLKLFNLAQNLLHSRIRSNTLKLISAKKLISGITTKMGKQYFCLYKKPYKNENNEFDEVWKSFSLTSGGLIIRFVDFREYGNMPCFVFAKDFVNFLFNINSFANPMVRLFSLFISFIF